MPKSLFSKIVSRCFAASYFLNRLKTSQHDLPGFRLCSGTPPSSTNPLPAPIRPQISPGFPFPVQNPGPYRAPSQSEPKMAVFLQSDEIKRSHKHVFLPVFRHGRVLDRPGKRICTNAFMARIKTLYGALFGNISANGAVKRGISRAGRNGAFYGRIFQGYGESYQRLPAVDPGSGALAPMRVQPLHAFVL